MREIWNICFLTLPLYLDKNNIVLQVHIVYFEVKFSCLQSQLSYLQPLFLNFINSPKKEIYFWNIGIGARALRQYLNAISLFLMFTYFHTNNITFRSQRLGQFLGHYVSSTDNISILITLVALLKNHFCFKLLPRQLFNTSCSVNTHKFVQVCQYKK